MPVDEYLLDGLQLFLGKCRAWVGEIFTDELKRTSSRLIHLFKGNATALPKGVSDSL
ncbi:hypothetical protein DI53_1773 [Sphingobacterium deserti]|uniref:Uncharacterized protein n=1 Tax=Sphingobacterium deserti TaxID=1229276 RepID=A0A0B8T823_9SPHI|nr:hypothetical protein DI53_1773 [Sphingobacterium deserti]